MKKTLSRAHKDLVRRYLIWAYKTTREDFERIERKTTQLAVDDYIFKYFTAHKLKVPQEFKTYIANKRNDEQKLKYSGADKKSLNPQYVYLKNRLSGIEAAITYFLGGKELKCIAGFYEKEFTRRIMEAREH